MHARTGEVLSHLAHYRAELLDSVQAVPADQRNQRPAPDRWSVAEILDHLGIVEGNVVRMLRKHFELARAEGLRPEPEDRPVVPSVPVALVLDRSHRIEAPERILPTTGLTAEAAWQVLVDRREALENLVGEFDGFALGDVVPPYPHPIFGPFNGWQWIVFLGAHEGRHSAQIREQAAQVVG
jgi:hypothetical protein